MTSQIKAEIQFPSGMNQYTISKDIKGGLITYNGTEFIIRYYPVIESDLDNDIRNRKAFYIRNPETNNRALVRFTGNRWVAEYQEIDPVLGTMAHLIYPVIILEYDGRADQYNPKQYTTPQNTNAIDTLNLSQLEADS